MGFLPARVATKYLRQQYLWGGKKFSIVLRPLEKRPIGGQLVEHVLVNLVVVAACHFPCNQRVRMLPLQEATQSDVLQGKTWRPITTKQGPRRIAMAAGEQPKLAVGGTCEGGGSACLAYPP